MPLDRLMQLDSRETVFYQAILRAFPEHPGPPEPAWLTATAAALGLDAEVALSHFVELDLLVRDPVSGTLLSMYPFSVEPTRHVVVLADGRQVYSLCAIDALGIPFMLDQDVVIQSADPITQEPIRVQVERGEVSWEPQTTVVLTVSLEEVKSVKAKSCCPMMNFFAGQSTAEAYRQTHCAVTGLLLSQEEAVARGKRAFGDRLAASLAG